MEMTVSPPQELDFKSRGGLSVVPPKRILVVEDDPFWQMVIERSIQRASETSKILFATSAREAIDLLEHNRFNLIIADQYLDGDKTGFELWHDCKRRGIKAPFLLTSGSVNFPDEIVEELPVRYVSKPFVAAEIRRTLNDLLKVDLAYPRSIKNPCVAGRGQPEDRVVPSFYDIGSFGTIYLHHFTANGNFGSCTY